MRCDPHWIQGPSLDVVKASIRHYVFDPRPAKLVEEGLPRRTIPQRGSPILLGSKWVPGR
jgi:hypothetical protein